MSLPASANQLLVSETFVSLQGEGVSTGAPSAFLRLGNCNLSCVYCDTPYTWDESRYDLGNELQAREVQEIAQWVAEHAPGRLIITGGEPLLQHKLLAELLRQVDALCQSQTKAAVYVEVETNATIAPSDALSERVQQWNVSPKLACSAEPVERRIKDKVLRDFSKRSNAFFKFVVTDETAVQEVQELMADFSLEPSRVQLMPEATTAEQLRERSPAVAGWALRSRLRFSGRLHLELYGGKRGT